MRSIIATLAPFGTLLLFFGSQLFIAVDQLLNVLLFGFADETLSARSYRAKSKGRIFGSFMLPIIDALFFWQKQTNDKGHCYNAYLKEKEKRGLPPEYRDAVAFPEIKKE